MTKKILNPLAILFLCIGLSACSSDSGGSDGPGPDADKVVDQVLSWFTADMYKQTAPVTLVGGESNDGDGTTLSHTMCHCNHNQQCGPDEEFYNYAAFSAALKKYPEMFTDPDTGKGVNEAMQKRILAAYFANVSQETNGQGDGGPTTKMLCYAGEFGHDDSTAEGSNGKGCDYDSAENKYCYSGRGPLQLTWKSNYTAFSQAYFGDTRVADEPKMLTEDGALSFASSFWFFSNYNKGPSLWKDGLSQFIIHPRNVDGKKRDFAYTIFLINGGIECKDQASGPSGPVKAGKRVEAFKSLLKDFTGKAPTESDDQLNCQDMSSNNDNSKLANAPYWES